MGNGHTQKKLWMSLRMIVRSCVRTYVRTCVQALGSACADVTLWLLLLDFDETIHRRGHYHRWKTQMLTSDIYVTLFCKTKLYAIIVVLTTHARGESVHNVFNKAVKLDFYHSQCICINNTICTRPNNLHFYNKLDTNCTNFAHVNDVSMSVT